MNENWNWEVLRWYSFSGYLHCLFSRKRTIATINSPQESGGQMTVQQRFNLTFSFRTLDSWVREGKWLSTGWTISLSMMILNRQRMGKTLVFYFSFLIFISYNHPLRIIIFLVIKDPAVRFHMENGMLMKSAIQPLVILKDNGRLKAVFLELSERFMNPVVKQFVIVWKGPADSRDS